MKVDSIARRFIYILTYDLKVWTFCWGALINRIDRKIWGLTACGIWIVICNIYTHVDFSQQEVWEREREYVCLPFSMHISAFMNNACFLYIKCERKMYFSRSCRSGVSLTHFFIKKKKVLKHSLELFTGISSSQVTASPLWPLLSLSTPPSLIYAFI